MKRVCFQLQIRPEALADYIERHRAVDTQVLDAIHESGRRNYSLFVRADGLLIGYYEVEDDATAASALAKDPRTAKWEEESREYFANLTGRADQSAPGLTEVFNLEDQLLAASQQRQPNYRKNPPPP